MITDKELFIDRFIDGFLLLLNVVIYHFIFEVLYVTFREEFLHDLSGFDHPHMTFVILALIISITLYDIRHANE